MPIRRAKNKRESRLHWFGVKTVYRTAAVGKPIATDSAYDPNMTMVEERVVLFKVRNIDQAIIVAEKEAVQYARDRHVNPYGQKVITRYLEACDAFELIDTPSDRREVFSATEVVPRLVRDKAVVDQRLGRVESARDTKRRRNILNRDFSGRVKRGI